MAKLPLFGEGASWWKTGKIIVPFVIFLGILTLAAGLRLNNLGSSSLTQDESSIIEFTAGLIERGYPSRGVKELKVQTTYELLPYFIAPSILFLGISEWTVRLPAFLFSLGTLCLLFAATRVWFNTRTALLASFLYAVSPWAVYWAQNCFWPSQAQFFAMLSAWYLYFICREDEVRSSHIYLAVLALCATYLSWEGSGLLIFGFGIVILWLRWGRWEYLRNPHTWICLLIGLSVVLWQLIRRKMYQEPYLFIGSNVANVTTPQLTFTDPNFDPFLYLDIVSSQQNLVIAAFFIAGLFFLSKDWSLRFIYGLAILLPVLYSLLLIIQTLRYVYIVLPFCLIASSAGTFALIDWIVKDSDMNLLSIRLPAYAGILAILLFQGLTLSNHGINFREIGDKYQTYVFRELEPDEAKIDFKYIFSELHRQYRPGDVIIARSPFLLHMYSGMTGDFLLQSITSSVVKYRMTNEMPYYSDKHMANAVLRNRQEFDAVLNNNDRVWFVAAPLEATATHALGEDLFDHVERTMKLNAESHSVRLYLWEK